VQCSKRKLILIVLSISIALLLLGAGCQEGQQAPGTLQGTVSIGPIWPVERPGQNPPVSPKVFEARKIIVYNKSKTRVVETLDLTQIDQSAKGSYSVQLKPGEYIVDINRIGIDSSSEVPRKVEIESGQTDIVDIDIDTGIR
jgi:hypothetical protein